MRVWTTNFKIFYFAYMYKYESAKFAPKIMFPKINNATGS